MTYSKKVQTIHASSINDFNKNSNPGGGKGSSSNNAGKSGSGGSGQGGYSIQPVMSSGASDETNDILINYNELAKKDAFSEAFFRDLQIYQVLGTLSTKNHPNALLKGDAGVGKTQIVEEIARRIVKDDPITKGMLGDKIIYELPLSRIVSGSSLVGQLEEKIHQVISFAKNPKNKAILFIDEIHQLTGDGGGVSESYQKIAQILKPELGRGQIRVIGATTTQEAVTFMSDPALSRRWSDINVPELSPEETAEIILKIRDSFQVHHNVLLPDNLIEQAVLIGDEYKQYGSHRPDSTITLIDKAMADARILRLEQKEEAKTNQAMQMMINAHPMPILTMAGLKKSALKLLTGNDRIYTQNAQELKDALTQNIVGQNAAKEAVIDAVSRLSLNLVRRYKPASFLFAGPSGTGKTEIAKQIAEAVFGDKRRMIHINMSEYSSPASLTRIVGSPTGYIGSNSKKELPFDSLENNPYQLILLDEFEKADTSVQRFFMQALDEGMVKNNRNKEIDFSRTIIVATTNAGAVDFTKKTVGFNQDENANKISNQDAIRILKQSFDTELLNRFEHLIAFESISTDAYKQILGVKYNQIIDEAIQNRKDIDFEPKFISAEDTLTNDKIAQLAEESYTPASNGRPAERTIRRYIEDELLNNPNQTQFNLL